MSKEQDPPKEKSEWKKIVIAYIIISLSFFIIGWMLYIQQDSAHMETELLDKAITNKLNKTQIDSISTISDNMLKSNQTLFNILLPVFSAWVVAVVAYYFHSETQQKSTDALQESYKRLADLTPNKKKITVGDLLKKSGSSLIPLKNQMDDKMYVIKKNAEKYGNVVIVKDLQSDEPLGIIYEIELKDIQHDDKTTLRDAINSKNGVIDHITQDKWTPNGIQNYATVSIGDDISTLYQNMSDIKLSNSSFKMDIRALVVQGNQLVAILDYETISNANA